MSTFILRGVCEMTNYDKLCGVCLKLRYLAQIIGEFVILGFAFYGAYVLIDNVFSFSKSFFN